MSENRYVVPDGMLEAAENSMPKDAPWEAFSINGILEAALRWLAENPMVPTSRQYHEDMDFESSTETDPTYETACSVIAKWQRLCFLAPEPEVPEAVKDLLLPCDTVIQQPAKDRNADILEAFRRGQKSK